MRRILRVLLLPAFCCAAFGAEEDAPAVRLPEVRQFTLSNGMQFLVLRRSEAPVFHGVITFRVGGVDDPKNVSGMAHLFEHMAFKGTKAIGTRDWAKEKPLLDLIEATGEELTALEISGEDPARRAVLRQELDRLQAEHKTLIRQNEFGEAYIEAGGNRMNATTGSDRTNYFISLPSNRLELWMLLESERLRDPVLREFYVERDVVPEERRMRVDTSPRGRMFESLLATAYTAHPYRVPVIGWMSDIQKLTMAQARAFYNQYYSPDNGFGVIVGDVDLAKTRALLERYFGRIPKRGAPPLIPTVEPPQEGERRSEVRFQAAPRLMMAWHKPGFPHADDAVAELVASALGEGLTSRLHRRLVLKDRIARGVSASNGVPGDRAPNLLVVSVEPLKGHPLAECEAAIDEEIARFVREGGATEAELKRALASAEVGLLGQMDTNEGLARLLAWGHLTARDWKEPWRSLDRIRKVTAEDTRAFASRYLVRSNRSVVTLLPPEAP